MSKNFATIAVHVGSEPDAITGAVVPPIRYEILNV